MKILTKEEEAAHYNATLKGGFLGGAAGLGLGVLGIYGASLRFPAFRQLTVPLRAFLVTSSTTFGAIVTADHYSRSFEASRHPDEGFQDASARARAEEASARSNYEKFMAWGKENRYPIVGVSWVASMAIALGIVGRSPYLSTAQKLVQARVYAQSLTVAVLLASAAFEISDQGKGEGRWETVRIIDPNDPEHKHVIEKKVHHEEYAGEDQWKDMIEAEEEKIKDREKGVKDLEKKEEASHKPKKGKEQDTKKDTNKEAKEDTKKESKEDTKKESKGGSKKEQMDEYKKGLRQDGANTHATVNENSGNDSDAAKSEQRKRIDQSRTAN